MLANTPRKMFVNLPVRDLNRSMSFFSTLGFTFNPRFTDEKAACMVVSEEAFVMLLTEPFFKTLTHRRVCNTAKDIEGLFALSCRSKAEVDEMVTTAIAAGGKHAMDKQDHGFMYGWSFCDLDGHHWEVIWMDSTTVFCWSASSVDRWLFSSQAKWRLPTSSAMPRRASGLY